MVRGIDEAGIDDVAGVPVGIDEVGIDDVVVVVVVVVVVAGID